MNKKCPECGKELLPEWKFCPTCGKFILEDINFKLNVAEQLLFIGKQLISSEIVDNKWDFEEAAQYFLASAKLGNVNAKNELASCYFNGWGLEKNCEAAKRWWLSAAEQHCAMAIDFLKYLYGITID